MKTLRGVLTWSFLSLDVYVVAWVGLQVPTPERTVAALSDTHHSRCAVCRLQGDPVMRHGKKEFLQANEVDEIEIVVPSPVPDPGKPEDP
jgi:hypothetical protein